MITIKFPDADTELEALGFLLGRFPGRVLKTGAVLVPDAALQALALEGYQFTVVGPSTYEQQIASFRNIVPAGNITMAAKYLANFADALCRPCR